jgi:hypothetical protein
VNTNGTPTVARITLVAPALLVLDAHREPARARQPEQLQLPGTDWSAYERLNAAIVEFDIAAKAARVETSYVVVEGDQVDLRLLRDRLAEVQDTIEAIEAEIAAA